MKGCSLLPRLSLLCLIPGLLLVGRQGWLWGKACLAEVLIERAFEAHLEDGRPHPPWSWADLYPVARLKVPRLGVRRLVLAGATGGSLAFGPGHIDGTAEPGSEGNCVLAGHRDTWFAFLQELRIGDALSLATRAGKHRYVVQSLRVVAETDVSILELTDSSRLTLVTCYPFSGWLQSPWRYVVICRKTA